MSFTFERNGMLCKKENALNIFVFIGAKNEIHLIIANVFFDDPFLTFEVTLNF